MTPPTDPGQGPEIDLTRRRPAMQAVPRIPSQPRERTLPDRDIERGARIVGMVDGQPRHRDGGPVRKRDAIMRLLLGSQR